MRLEKYGYMISVQFSTISMMKRASNHITMFKRFLSHDKTKADLTDYMAMKVLPYNTDTSNLVTTSSSGYTRSNASVEFENNNQEEADTVMINHEAFSSRRNPSSARIVIFSPDIPCYSCSRP